MSVQQISADVEAAPAVLVPALDTYTSIRENFGRPRGARGLGRGSGSSLWVSAGTHKEAPTRVRGSALALDTRAHLREGAKMPDACVETMRSYQKIMKE